MAGDDLPVFKPSGEGMGKDLMGLKHQEVMVEGWWAGQFKQKLDAICPKVWVDGVLCYDYQFKIGSGSCRDGAVKDFLETVGFTDNTTKDICDGYKNDEVKEIWFDWKQNYSYKEEDFEEAVNLIVAAIPTFDRIEVVNEVLVKHAGPYTGVVVSDTFNVAPMASYGKGDVFGRWKGTDNLRIDAKGIKIFDDKNKDITSQASKDALTALKTILWISGNKFLNRTKVELISFTQETGPPTGGGIAHTPITRPTYGRVISKETFGNKYNLNFNDQFKVYKPEHLLYKMVSGFKGQTSPVSDPDGKFMRPLFASAIWKFREQFDTMQRGEIDGGLFYRKTYYTSITNMNPEAKIYLVVNSLDYCSPRHLRNALSRYANVYVEEKSCGGFFSCFFEAIGGLFNKILTIISSIAYYIPMFKLEMMILIFIVSGGKTWAVDKEEFVRNANIVGAMVISLVLTYFTGVGGGIFMQAFMAAMTAYTLYSGYSNLQEMRDSVEYQEAMAQMKEKERKLIEAKLEQENESAEANKGEVDENIFMPLDRDMKKQERDVYGDGSVTSVKFTEGIK